MAILNFASRRSRQRPIFLVTDRGYRPWRDRLERDTRAPLPQAHAQSTHTVFTLQQEARKPLLRDGRAPRWFQAGLDPKGGISWRVQRAPHKCKAGELYLPRPRDR